MLFGQARGGGELLGREIDAGNRGAATGHPAGHVGGATTQLDRPHPGHVGGQERQLRLGDSPDSPLGLVERPQPFAKRDPISGPGVPVNPVDRDVLRLAHPGGRYRRTAEPTEPASLAKPPVEVGEGFAGSGSRVRQSQRVFEHPGETEKLRGKRRAGGARARIVEVGGAGDPAEKLGVVLGRVGEDPPRQPVDPPRSPGRAGEQLLGTGSRTARAPRGWV